VATVVDAQAIKRSVTAVDTQAIIDLGELSLAFGRVDRVTYHPDGETFESDTDHTVMLGLIACAFADAYLPELRQGSIAQFALVHDVVEVYAGDTSTLNISEDGKAAKKAREAAAEDRIRTEFERRLPWLPWMIELYEQQRMPEARYVKAMDKLLPKITHILNDCQTIKDEGMPLGRLKLRYANQLVELESYAGDFPPLFELRAELVEMVVALHERGE
jgi:putative hydrolases of HD superfamily